MKKDKVYLPILATALISLIAIGGLGFVSFSSPQKTNPNNPNKLITTYTAKVDQMSDKDYETFWKEVETLQNSQKTKEARAVCQKIYDQAEQDGNESQKIKALLFMYKFDHITEEDSGQKIVKDLYKRIKKANQPEKAVLQFILAELYWQYYQQNSQQINQRSQGPGGNDFLTWDGNRLSQEARELYLASLQPAQKLQGIPVKDFTTLISNYQKESQKYRPTLYDFISHKTINFFKNDLAHITKAADQFRFDDPKIFADASTFAKNTFINTDENASKYHALKIYQDLTKFHLTQTDKSPLLSLTLDRLKFVHSNAILSDKNDLYLSALEKLEKIAPNNDFTAMVAHQRARFHSNRGKTYDPVKTPELRHENRKAFDVCQTAVKNAANYHNVNPRLLDNCRIVILEIEKPHSQVQVTYTNVPEKPILASIEYKNMTKLFGRSILITKDIKKQIEALPRGTHHNYFDIRLSFLKKQKPVKEWSTDLPDDQLYNKQKAKFKIPAHPPGQYYFLHSDNKDFNFSKEQGQAEAIPTHITHLSAITDIDRQNGDLIIYTVNSESGQKMEGVDIIISERIYNKKTRKHELKVLKQGSSDTTGKFQCRPKQDQRSYRGGLAVELQTDDDYYEFNTSPPYTHHHSSQAHEIIHFFTDRSIYRPGQKVYFKGIMYTKNPNQKHKIITNQEVKVQLMDANSQKVSEVELTSNEFGSINGSFDLPTNLLNGSFTISCYGDLSYGFHSFNVEEYKRPKFEVNIDPVKSSFKLNETVKITGHAKTYAGSNIDDAKISYRIVRKASFPYQNYWKWYRPLPTSPEMEIKNGTTKTDEKGKFELDFIALPDLSLDPKDKPQFNYEVIVDITDKNGETRTAKKALSVAYVSLLAKIEIPEKLDREGKTTFPIATTNLEGQFKAADVNIRIQELLPPDQVFRSNLLGRTDTFILDQSTFIKNFPNDVYKDENQYDKWQKGKMVFEKQLTTTTESTIDLNNLRNWGIGVYKITLSTKDKYGSPVESQKVVKVFSFEEEAIPDNSLFWHQFSTTSLEPGEVLTIACGSAAKNANILLSVLFKDKVVKKQWVKVSEGQKVFKIKVKEEWRGNFRVGLAMMKFNRFHKIQQIINVPWTNKKLDITVKTFRDKLLPGQEEKWTLTIKGMDGDQAAAELMTTLYDASLDGLKPHNWLFNPYTTFNNFYEKNMFGNSYNHFYIPDWKSNKGHIQVNSYRLVHDRLNLHGASINKYDASSHGGGRGGGGRGNMPFDRQAASMERSNKKSKSSYKAKADMASTIPNDNSSGKEEGNTNENTAPIVRKNLQETAFFFPDIKTNPEGDFVLSFTAPEVLTAWKWMSIAHTKDLKIGSLLKETFTQKELMVFPNPPRFFRERDVIWFSTKVSNLTQKGLKGTVKLELFDALTMKPINAKLGNKKNKQSIDLKAEQSDVVSWQLVIPEGIQVVTWRVTAQAGNFADGEENTLPVLSNRQLVTESMPLPIRGKETKQFTFENLKKADKSNTLTHQQMTLEFASQPAWYAIQALPYLMEDSHQSTDEIASRYYANALASHIANSNPKIKKVFDSWKEERVTAAKSSDPVDSGALLSNLQKNQDLKSLLLEETPWVMAAKNENERKHRLAALFDLDRMSSELKAIEKELQQRQASNGGWSWFPGMDQSWYITQQILTNFGHLQKLGVKRDPSINNMLNKAVNFIDQAMFKYYKNLKRNDRLNKKSFNRMGAHYLYTRSFFKDRPIREAHQEAVDYFLKNNTQYWTKTDLCTQAMAAIALHRWKNGNSQAAKDIMEAFRQNAVQNEEMGMYYKTNIGGWYWYNAPIETQALIIEAFDEVEDDLATMNELRIWLLKQKQTQDWKTSKATVQACYALLLRGTNWVNSEELVDITIGSQKLDPHNMPEVAVEAGTGYFQKQWQAEEITPKMANITVSKKDESIGWGAVYWQYFEDLDKITRAETPLSIEKELFKEVNTKNGPQLEKLSDQAVLEVGDKVKVRIVIRVDRKMKYLHLKDMRAAGFEPINVISRYKQQDGLGYYESTKDAATNFFIDHLPKGTYVFEYPLRVAQKGNFSNGITTMQCMYAPEFTSQSEGIRVKVR